ncbi:hypothetical protein L1987_50963 [Smallanthus sonchifolius]|uniref:Uncharacterized protein n=1 Tax=Smallanthus sonchifolius TaxID=185202 RepID=A0ACB9ENX8_9ASTR|nr:hypothetical protein L1987_50963 [Smallanthus sonchifolius]
MLGCRRLTGSKKVNMKSGRRWRTDAGNKSWAPNFISSPSSPSSSDSSVAASPKFHRNSSELMEDEQANEENISRSPPLPSAPRAHFVKATPRKRIKRKSNVSLDDCNQDQAVCNQDELSKVAKDMDPLGEDEDQFDSQRGVLKRRHWERTQGKEIQCLIQSQSTSIDLHLAV